MQNMIATVICSDVSSPPPSACGLLPDLPRQRYLKAAANSPGQVRAYQGPSATEIQMHLGRKVQGTAFLSLLLPTKKNHKNVSSQGRTGTLYFEILSVISLFYVSQR